LSGIYRSSCLAHDIERFLAEEDHALAQYPVCCRCGNHVQQDSIVRIDGNYYCDECLNALRESIE